MIYLSGVVNETIASHAATQRFLGLMAQPKSHVERFVPRFTSWAADNGAFGAFLRRVPFEQAVWERWIRRLPDDPLFVVVPDAVGDHAATAASWAGNAELVHGLDYRAAFVLQNGCVSLSQVPADADAVFIGGDDAYKLGSDAARVCWAAKERGLWVHMGRVNSRRRFLRASAMGCDSADGTFLRFGPPATQLARVDAWIAASSAEGGQLDIRELSESEGGRMTGFYSSLPPRRAGLRRGTGLVSKTARARMRQAAWAQVREEAGVRSGYRCERCGRTLPLSEAQGHHRLPRRFGDHTVSNCAYLCADCHARCHANPAEANALGWILREGQDPAAVPVWLGGRKRVLLATGGRYETAKAETGDAA